MSLDTNLEPTIIANCPACGKPRSSDAALCDACLQRGFSPAAPDAPEAGRVIGSFILKECLGEGGMGEVWLATHSREDRIRAAVKFIRHQANPDRFLAERRFLASLAHPNIARIYDVGQTDDGALYLTMEFVEGGAPFTKWCDSQRLSIPRRLRLFQEVCHAVQHIHLKGLIHRDLKPANILVTPGDGQPVPRIIDFGIAKPIADAGAAEFVDPSLPALPDSDDGALLTRAGRFVGTLEYASPEQLRGGKVDPRSDVYSLGLILYELLTGLKPHSKEEMTVLRERAGITRKAISSLSDDDVLRLAGLLADERLTAPSERLRRATTTSAASTLQDLAAKRGLAAQALPRLLTRDLEAIVMKSLAPAADDRYASPDALAGDIENFLHCRPVTAIPPTLSYLARKFLQRYPWQAAAAAALVLSLAGGIVASSIFARSESRAKAAAEKARAGAEATRNDAEERFYAADLQGAGFDITEARIAAARSRMLTHQVESSGRDLRGWEYYYLRSRTEQNLLHTPAHTGGVTAAALSPDGETVATAGEDRTVALWEARSLLPVRRMEGHANRVLSVGWSPDGRYVASCDGGEVIVWQVATGQRFAWLRAATGGNLRALAWAPESSGHPPRLAVGGLQFDILTAEVPPDGGELRPHVLAARQSYVTGLAWSPDGTRLAASHLLTGDRRASDGATGVAVFDAERGIPERNFKPLQGSDTYAVAWHPDGRWLAAGDKHSAVRIIDLQPPVETSGSTGVPIVVPLNLHREYVSAVAWLPQGELLVSASGDGTVRFHSRDEEGKWTGEARFGHLGAVTAATVGVMKSSDPARRQRVFPVCFTGGADGTLRAWRAGLTDLRGDTGGLGSWASAVKFRPGSRVVATGRFSGAVWLIDTRNWRYVELPATEKTYVFDLDWSPDGARLAFACNGAHRVEIHTPYAPGEVTGFPLPYARHVAWSRSGRYLAAAGRAQCAVWDTGQQKVICDIEHGAGSLAWGASDSELAIGGRDGHIALWNPQTNTLTRTLRPAPPPIPELVPNQNEPPRQVHDLHWNTTGTRLLYGTQDSVAAMLDPATGTELVRLAHRHINGIWRVAWSPDETRAATAGQDGTLRIFDAARGTELARFDHGEGAKEVRGLDWSADGEVIVTCGFDQKVRIWDAGRGKLLEKADGLTPETIHHMDRAQALAAAREMTITGRAGLALAAGTRASSLLSDPAAAKLEITALQNNLRQTLTDPDAVLGVSEDDLPEQEEPATQRSPGKADYASAALEALARDDKDNALEILDAGAAAFPDSTTIWSHRGAVLWAGFNRHEEAMRDLEKSVTIATAGDRNTYAQQLSAALAAACLHASGDRAGATARMQKVLQKWPDLELPRTVSGRPWPAVISEAYAAVKAAATAAAEPPTPAPPAVPPEAPPAPSPSQKASPAPRYKEVDAR